MNFPLHGYRRSSVKSTMFIGKAVCALLTGWMLVDNNPSLGQKTPVQYVETRIGTAPSTTQSARLHSEAGSELKGQTVPMVGVPHGMTQWTAQTRSTETKCIAPYYYNDHKFQGFRGTHWLNGSCVQDYGSFTVMPLSGELVLNPEARGAAFDHKNEKTSPDYYGVWLDEAQIQAEVTAVARAAMMRFKFSAENEAFIIVEPNSDEGLGFVEIFPEKGEIVGYNPVHRIYQGAGQSAGFSGYFVMKFDKPFIQYGVWSGDTLHPASKMMLGAGNKEKLGAYAGFGEAKQTVNVKIGTSFTSIEGARRNLETETKGQTFETMQKAAGKAWNAELSKMLVTGSETDKTLFYSALYRTKLSPRLYSDVDGAYPSFAGGTPVQKAMGFKYYCDFSMWDTFRAGMPLQVLLEPAQAGDMVQSLVKKAEQGGWMPIFPIWNHYTAAMIGDHVTSVMADAYQKGIRNFEVESGYAYLRKNAFEVNTDRKSYESGKGRRALASYLKYGYVPLEDSVWQAFHKREQVSRTLEYAYDDFCLSVLAEKLGKSADARALKERALNYKNVIDPVTGYARGRYANGSWFSKFDPFAKRSSFITEGSPAQYTWFVPQDVGGLMQHIGGKEAFLNKLDTLFDQNYYWHGNEPNHQIAYLYSFAGQPWKTQKWVRKIIREEYDNGQGGLSGNEDGGQMSAWLVFSMAGFYPVTPGTPVYVIGSPIFNSVAISTAKGKKFVIDAKNVSESAHFIQSATLNGIPFTKTFLTHDQLMAGGRLVLQMGVMPNQLWGSKSADAPPSLSDIH